MKPILYKPHIRYLTGLEIAALAGVGVSAATTGVNAGMQTRLNRVNREWQEKMYGRQRADALADVAAERDWASPANQMALYKAAGVSPAQALAGNPIQSPATRSSQVGNPDTKAPQLDVSALAGLAQIQEISSRSKSNEADARLTDAKVITEALEQAERQYDLAIKSNDLALQRSTMKDIVRLRKLQADILETEIEINRGEPDRRERQTSATERQAGASERQAGASERQAGVAEKNAETNRRSQVASERLSNAQIDKIEAEIPYIGIRDAPFWLRLKSYLTPEGKKHLEETKTFDVKQGYSLLFDKDAWKGGEYPEPVISIQEHLRRIFDKDYWPGGEHFPKGD